jgi:hypothetical protein
VPFDIGHAPDVGENRRNCKAQKGTAYLPERKNIQKFLLKQLLIYNGLRLSKLNGKSAFILCGASGSMMTLGCVIYLTLDF